MKKKSKKEECFICSICGEEHGLDNIYNVTVKKQEKKICKECADIIHGLV